MSHKSRFAQVASIAALAVGLIAGPSAHAQNSYNSGDPTVVSGSVTFDRGQTVPGTETYTVASRTAVLDFQVFENSGGGVINFQNPDTSAIYQSALGGPNFTVLNRITGTSQAVGFYGNVVSRLRDAQGVSSVGGSVWFYSPGGIVVGGSATFNVGSLLLTTADPTGGSGVIGSTNSFTLNSAENSTAFISVDSGATLRALAPNSYIALVAPSVNHYGRTEVNGSAAFVAAERATLTINQGLFDIAVEAGSSVEGVALQLSGTVTGPASTGAADRHGIYAVAVPKNQAITMLIAPDGQLGFEPATAVGVENGTIYLQSGGGISVSPNVALPNRITPPNTSLLADMSVTLGNVTSSISAQASRDLNISTSRYPGEGGEARTDSIVGAAYFFGGSSASLILSDDAHLKVTGSLDLQSFGGTNAGQAAVSLNGSSTLEVSGRLGIYADGTDRIASAAYDLATGGFASLLVSNAGLTAGSVTVSANGLSFANGAATGGSAGATFAEGAAATIANALTVRATATGSGAEGVAVGGTASLSIDASALTAGSLSVAALGLGNRGGNTVGGTATLTTSGGRGGYNIGGEVSIDAGAIGGSADAQQPASNRNGGSATGGSASIMLGGGTTGNGGATLIQTGGFAGGFGDIAAATGGAAQGGTGRLTIDPDAVLTAASLLIRADAFGGGASANAAGAAAGGTVAVRVAGRADVGATQLFSNANGGRSGGAGAGGGAQGGTLTVDVSGAGRLEMSGALGVNTDGSGGTALAAAGGAGRGGSAALNVTAGGVVAGTEFNASANGFGGVSTGSAGGLATGGSTTVSLGAGDIDFTSAVRLTARGNAGTGASGGVGTGGMAAALMNSNGGTIETGSFTLDAGASGGAASAAGAVGGAAIAGRASLTLADASDGPIARASLGSLSLSASSVGGAVTGGGTAIAGDAAGGEVSILVGRSTVLAATAAALAVDARGGNSNGGDAGDATGGIARLSGTGTSTIGGTLTLRATATGGLQSGSRSAGTARGGTASLDAASGGMLSTLGNVSLTTNATGGATGVGTGTAGDSFGGTSRVTTSGGAITLGGSTTLSADARGTSGTVVGGTVSTIAESGTLRMAALRATASAAVLNGTDAATSQGGTVRINATAGDIAIDGATILDTGAAIDTTRTATGAATGGAVSITAAAGRTLTLGGPLTISVAGRGSAGAGRGGAIDLLSEGTIALRGDTVAIATGTGRDGFGGRVAFGAGTGNLIADRAVTLDAGGSGIAGGTGTGGLAQLAASGPTGRVAATGPLALTALGNGGAGGGAGRGGGALITTETGAVIMLAGGASADASGIGGAGGGTGIGGNASFNSRGAIAAQSGLLRVAANGRGGDATSGANGQGGVGIGGAASFSAVTDTANVNVGGSLRAVRLDASASGTGGNGAGTGAGGAATGGGVSVVAQAGNGLLLADSINVTVDAVGGNGATGGSATGGSAAIGTIAGPATDFATGLFRGDTVTVSANATSFGGDALGGDGTLASRGNSITLGTYAFTATANGGRAEGGRATILSADRASSATRGSITIGSARIDTGGSASAAADGGSLTLSAANGDIAIATLAATGSGGRTGATGAISGAARSSAIDARNGAITVTRTGIDAAGDLSVSTGSGAFIDLGMASLAASNDLMIGTQGATSAGATLFDSLTATAGRDITAAQDLTMRSGALTLAAGRDLTTMGLRATDIVGTAGNTLNVGTIEASARAALIARGGTVTSGAITTRGDLLLLANGTVATGVIDAGGALVVGNPSAFAAGSDPFLLIGTPQTASGGVVRFGNTVRAARVDISATGVEASSIVTTGGTLSIVSQRDIALGRFASAGDATLTASGRIDVAQPSRATGSVALDSGSTVSAVAVDAGSLAVTGRGQVGIGAVVTSSGAASIATRGDIALGTVDTATDLLAVADGGRIDLTGTARAGRNVVLLADRAIGTRAMTAGGFVYAAGSANRSRLAADGTVPATLPDAGGSAIAGTVDFGGDVAAQDVRVLADGTISTGGIGATRSIDLSGGTLTLNGALAAQRIALTGSDLMLGSTGNIGTTATESIAITARSGVALMLGDSVTGTGFRIDQAEFSRIRGGTIDIAQAASLSGAGLTIGDLAVTGGDGGNLASGVLTIRAAGDMLVSGNLRLVGAGERNGVTLIAPGTLRVVTDAGSIALSGANDALTGSLVLRATDTLVGTQAFLDTVATATDAQLARSAGAAAVTPAPEGYLRAGAIDLGATRRIVVQNSGSTTLAAGLTAGAGGLTLTSLALDGALATAIVYGRVADDAGFLTNADTRGVLRLARGTGSGSSADFTAASTVNGCPLAASVLCGNAGVADSAQQAIVTLDTDVQGIVGELAGIESAVQANRMTVGVTSAIDVSAITDSGLVTDPIGSAGNASLWGGEQNDDDDDDDTTKRGQPVANPASDGK